MSTSSYTPDAVQSSADDSCQPGPSLTPSLGVCSELDVMKRDRFELLSAYLDGEVTPEERAQVQTWLNSDPTAKCLYSRLVTLRQGLRQDPCPSPCEAEATLAGVFQCLNQRFRMVSMASVGVVAIGVLNVLSGAVSSGGLASLPASQEASSSSLQIALDQPAFPIPEVPTVVSADETLLPVSPALPIKSEL